MSALKVALKAAKQQLEDHLNTLLPAPQHILPEDQTLAAMRYSLFAGGKRLRPFLCLTIANLLGRNTDTVVLDVAAALECFHTYSLIHDDLPCMDDDTQRRGQPTCHVQFDEMTAVLAGDALQTFGFELLARHNAQLVSVAAQAVGQQGMVGGQMLDMRAEQEKLPLTEADLIRLQSKKTGALFLACTQCACHMAGASAEHQRILEAFTTKLGLLFQLTDDILDATATSAQLGKTSGKDHHAGKVTFVSFLGLTGAQQRANELHDTAQALLQTLGKPAPLLTELTTYIRHRTA